MTTELKATIDNRLWIPHTPKLEAKVRHTFEIRLYDEKKCDKCEYRPERHCDICEECPVEAYKGKFKLWRKKADDNGWKLGMPIGRPSLIKKVLGDRYKLRIRDRRSATFMQNRIKFTGTLYDNQKGPVTRMIAKRRGILEAPPRAGKTVMAVYIACKTKMKTLVLAKQYDWLKQFEETIYGTKHKDGSWKDKPQTNVPELEEKLGRKIAGFCKTPEDMDKYDICLCTYQSFITAGGKKRLKKIKDKFGLVVIDECDNVPALNYLFVVGEMNCKYMVGLTGTPERKDMRHELSEIVLGTVKAVAKVKTLVPRVEFHDSPAGTSYNYKMWHNIVNYLTMHKGRNKFIAKLACKDIKAGRSLVIPVERVKHVKILVDLINERMGKKVAVGFGGKDKGDMRDKIREGAKSGKIKCVVGMRKMVYRGLNVPRWDTLYVAMPISNPPNFKQETSRIRTLMDGKQEPLIRHIIENFGPTKGCFRTCYWQTYMPEGFRIDDTQKKIAKAFMGGGKAKAPPDSVIF